VLDQVAARRKLADIELVMAECAVKRLLWRQIEEVGVAAFDRHAPIDQCRCAFVRMQRNRQLQFRHATPPGLVMLGTPS
jgi:redox-regulated HSP33 family molecular chaperone